MNMNNNSNKFSIFNNISFIIGLPKKKPKGKTNSEYPLRIKPLTRIHISIKNEVLVISTIT